MLKYKFTLDAEETYQKLDVEDLYLAPDLTYFSGTTPYTSNLQTGDLVRYQMATDGDLFSESPINIKNVIRQGYVLYDKYYPVQTAKYCGKDITYVEYNGKIYYYYDGGFLINNYDDQYYFYECDEDVEEIPITVKSYIENGKVIVDDVSYNVDINNYDADGNKILTETLRYNEISSALTELNDSEVKIHMYPKNEWGYVSKFVVLADDNIELDVSQISTGHRVCYILLGTEGYNIVVDEESGYTYGKPVIIVRDNKVLIDELEVVHGMVIAPNDEDETLYATIGENKVAINMEYNEADEGEYILITIENENLDYPVGRKVIATCSNNEYEKILVETDEDGNEYIQYGSERYDIIADYCDSVVINGTEYMFTYFMEDESGKFGTIEVNAQQIPLSLYYDDDGNYLAIRRRMLMELNDSGYTEYREQTRPYAVNKYDGIDVDGIKYKVIREEDSSYVQLVKELRYELEILDVLGAANWLCKPIIKPNGLTKQEIIYKQIEAVNTIRDEDKIFEFYLKNNALGDSEITYKKVYDEQILTNSAMTPISSDDTVSPNSEDDSYSASTDVLKNLNIYKVIDYRSVPLFLYNTGSGNMLQENAIQNGIYDTSINNSINDNIDMEKDIYYPAYCSKTGDTFTKVTKLQFNLHFRTRNLDTWSLYSSTDSESLQNWFITDDEIYSSLLSTRDGCNKLMCSSDLLGYLKFTNDDVYNQRNKLAKSFLRISFYNSPDQNTHYLLSTATVFVDEYDLFKKYCSNQNNGTYTGTKFGESSNSIGVSLEPIENESFSMDDDNRLSIRFTVKDRYNTHTSSEGFYLYMFKNYSTDLVESTIYMSIDFNHAGNGKRIPFYVPVKVGTKSNTILDLYDDLDTIKEGIPIDEFYDQAYIPVKVKYSMKDKRFFYYLPDEYVTPLNDDRELMMFNLFEIKLKNEE